jgi:hypothetical protein
MQPGLIALISFAVWMVGVGFLVRFCCKREPHFTPPSAQRPQPQPSSGGLEEELQPLSPLPPHPDAQQLIESDRHV